MTTIKGAKVLRIGNSYGLTIPKAYLDNGLIDAKKRYNVILEEAKK